MQRWTLANALGLGLGLVAIRAAIPGFRGDQFQASPGGDAFLGTLDVMGLFRLIVLTGIPVGLTVSLLQWWAIRDRLPQARRWIPLTFGGLILGWGLGVAVGIPLGLLATALFPQQSPLVQTIIRYSIALAIGCGLGVGLGVCQRSVLVGQGVSGRTWLRASALGGGIGFSLMLLFVSLLDSVVESGSGWASVMASFVAGAVGGGIGSLPPGITLSRLNRQD